jgi:hypothetical protein
MSRRRNAAWIVPLALPTLIQGRSAFAGKAHSGTSDFPPVLCPLVGQPTGQPRVSH